MNVFGKKIRISRAMPILPDESKGRTRIKLVVEFDLDDTADNRKLVDQHSEKIWVLVLTQQHCAGDFKVYLPARLSSMVKPYGEAPSQKDLTIKHKTINWKVLQC